jgi:hypothetical protein
MELLELSMWFGVSLVFVVLLILGVRQVLDFFFMNKPVKTQESVKEIKRPQLTIRVDVYEGDTPKIIATDAEGRHMPDILQQEGQEKALNLVGYAKIPAPPFEAVREASTVPQGVEVEVPRTQVDEGLDVVFPVAPVSKQTKLEDIKAGIQPKE